MGFHTYRIPAMERCPDGTLVAFAEARRDDAGNSGRISIAMSRSTDGGKTWSPIEIIIDVENEFSCGNPLPVFDEKNGNLILIYNKTLAEDSESKILSRCAKDIRRTFVMASSNSGKTWEKLTR